MELPAKWLQYDLFIPTRIYTSRRHVEDENELADLIRRCRPKQPGWELVQVVEIADSSGVYKEIDDEVRVDILYGHRKEEKG